MLKNEKGSVTLIVLATVLFIFAVLATNLVYVSAKRKSQLEETVILQNVYGLDMKEAYDEQIAKIQAETTKIFDYTAKVEQYTANVSGIYLLEVYGAQGGNVSNGDTTYTGGNGGYSKGTIKLEKGQTIYIHVGKKGENQTVTDENKNSVTDENEIPVTVNNGGATYISTKEDATINNNQGGDILIVANGGGGATSTSNGAANAGEKYGNSNGYTNGLDNTETKTNERSGNGFAKISFYN